MDEKERKNLAEALIPLEVLYYSMKDKLFKELTVELQDNLMKSIESIRGLVFKNKSIYNYNL